jgi:hypothetical protein
MIGGGLKSSILKVLANAPKCKLYKMYSCLINSNAASKYNINNTSNYDGNNDGTLGKYNYIYLYLNSNNILSLDTTTDDDLNNCLM